MTFSNTVCNIEIEYVEEKVILVLFSILPSTGELQFFDISRRVKTFDPQVEKKSYDTSNLK